MDVGVGVIVGTEGVDDTADLEVGGAVEAGGIGVEAAIGTIVTIVAGAEAVIETIVMTVMPQDTNAASYAITNETT